ncbi:ERCC4 domain-containing protein [Aspergillus unguis]
MPEVISLISSTPPPPANTDRREASSIYRYHSSPPAPTLSSDFGFPQINDDEIDLGNPSKRRRLTPEPEVSGGSSRDNGNLPPPSNDPFSFLSDDILPPSDGPSNAHAPSRPPTFVLDSDPIVFTSSAPEPTRRSPSPPNRGAKGKAAYIDDNDLDIFGTKGKRRPARNNTIEDFSDPRFSDPIDLFDLGEGTEFAVPPLQSEFSGRTASLLASLQRPKSDNTSTSTRTKQDTRLTQDIDDDADDLPEPRAGRKPKAKTTKSTADKEAKAKEREAAKAQRDREKQLEKERKQRQKEEKAKEKQLATDIAEVNRLKVEKKNSTPEMILDLASSLRETSIGNQALEYMQILGVEHTFFDSPIRNVVKWRRKMKATYNKTLGYWEPCQMFIREEEHVMCILTAQEFVDMVTSALDSETPDTPNELELHVLRMKSAYPKCTVIYLIEGLTAWMRKNANSRNRAYQAEFRRNLDAVQGSQSQTSTSTSRRKKTNKPETPPIDDDTVEDALLSLQVSHNCLIHQTAAAPESAEWIKTFTEHVSTVPYRRERMNDNDSAFCMDTGQVKAGENAPDTYIRMLQEVSRVTASMAYGVVNQYPSVVDLVKGMRREGPGMLENVKKSANRNGALTDSRIGPAASRRLYKVFMNLDPQSTDT